MPFVALSVEKTDGKSKWRILQKWYGKNFDKILKKDLSKKYILINVNKTLKPVGKPV